MTELEWLKQESGLDDNELKAMEAVAGQTKFIAMLQKIIGSNEAATKAKTDAENARLAFEKRYQEEFIPEMRKVTQDALNARGEAARLQAQLKQAQEYGIVPDSVTPAAAEPPRAPGSSTDPNGITRDDFSRFEAAQANTILAVQDLSAEHFRLFKEPLGDSQGLVDEVKRQRALGHKDYSLRNAWEAKHNVPAKREEIAKASRQKEIDDAIAADRKARIQAGGDNPMVRSGVPSRFSTYKPSDANTAQKPWQVPAGQRKTAMQPWRDNAVAKLREANV
jgi:hypothetical protein